MRPIVEDEILKIINKFDKNKGACHDGIGNLIVKGVLHPDTKISMFCLFSPSSRRKSILFMYGCDRCV